jgi:hypothetical protein
MFTTMISIYQHMYVIQHYLLVQAISLSSIYVIVTWQLETALGYTANIV